MQVIEHYSKCEDAEITKHLTGDFPGGPVVESLLPMQSGFLGSIPDWGTKTPHGSWCGQKKREKSQKASNVLCLVEGVGSRQPVGI